MHRQCFDVSMDGDFKIVYITSFDHKMLIEYRNMLNIRYFGFVKENLTLYAAVKLRYRFFLDFWKDESCIEFGFSDEHMCWEKMADNRSLYIPYKFKVLVKAISRADLGCEGIFRKNANRNLVLQAYRTLCSIQKEKDAALLDEYNTHTLCNLFGFLFDQSSHLLFPVEFRKYLFKAWRIEKVDDLNTCLQILLGNLPLKNIHLLEFIASFIVNVSAINTYKNKKSAKGMNVYGICICLMPKIFLRRDESLPSPQLNIFIDFFTYFCDNCEMLLRTLPTRT